MVLDRDKCPTCFNYWVSHGRYNAGYYLLIADQHIPEAHSSRPSAAPRPSGPSVGELQTQLTNANSRANGLQTRLDAANTSNNNLQTQLNNANEKNRTLQTQLGAANSRANGLQNQLDTANAKINTLQSQLNSASSQIGSLQTQLGAAYTRANELQRQLDDCKKEKKKLEDEVEQLKLNQVNLEKVNKRLLEDMSKKDAEALGYHADKLAAENKIQIELEPYIQKLIIYLNDKGLTDYPQRT